MGNCFRACVLKNIDYVAHMFQNNPCVYNFSKINTNVEHKPMNSTGPSKNTICVARNNYFTKF